MKKAINLYRISCILASMFLLLAGTVRADKGDDVLSHMIKLSKTKGTVYRLLNEVSEQSGFLFIYDSNIIDNEKIVPVKKGTYSIREAIYLITENRNLDLSVIGNHILISGKPEEAPPAPSDTVPTIKKDSFLILQGTLADKYTGLPIEAGTVGVLNTSIGSVTNSNGEFRLILPDSLNTSTIVFSHLGYELQSMETSLLAGRSCMIKLEPKVISLQEVIVRIGNPLRILREMEEKRKKNYAQFPVYFTSFYREGIERKNKFVNLTEGIFKIYKAPYSNASSSDQVKLLKMRKITSNDERDTLITKMKSGINASLMLDLIKEMPDFLTPYQNEEMYTYSSTDVVITDNRVANVISFEQKKDIHAPLYRGEIYIDSENSALLHARFEINPKYITQAAGMLVEKRSRLYKITPQKVIYTVSYKLWNGLYYINHVRGDLHFKIKKKKQLFNTFLLHAYFEMVTCKIDTSDVSRFTRNEVQPTRTIFSDTRFVYDKRFWGNFNIIPPEEKLNEAINKISSKIEETERGK